MNIRRIKWKSSCICLGLIICCLLAFTAFRNTESFLLTSAAPQNDVIIILDSGHDAYAISIVT